MMITSKPHAHFQTMIKAPAMFQRDKHKTGRGIAHTKYRSSRHFDSI